MSKLVSTVTMTVDGVVDVGDGVMLDPSLVPAAVLSGQVQFAAFNIGGLANLKARGVPVKLIASGALYRPKAPTGTRRGAGEEVHPRPRPRRQEDRDRRAGDDRARRPAQVAQAGRRLPGRRDPRRAQRVRADDGASGPWTGRCRRAARAVRQSGASWLQTDRSALRRRLCEGLPDHGVDGAEGRRRERGQPVQERNPGAALWANQKRNQQASAAVLDRYAPTDAAVLRKMTRTRYSTRLRPTLAQPWIDAYAEFGVIPTSFSAIDLVR
jgi:hypothetical protein